MLYTLDIIGTFVFAVSGAFRAMKYELDVLGVLVVAVATGVGGGIIRDLLLGAVPPAVFQDEAYLLVCLIAGALVIPLAPRIARRWNRVMLADAVGLGVFAAIGAAKSADFGLGPLGIMMMAAMTATGGGVVRDLLVNEVPAVIKNDFYATAAIAGGGALLLAQSLGLGRELQLLSAMVVTSGLRFLAMNVQIDLLKIHKKE